MLLMISWFTVASNFLPKNIGLTSYDWKKNLHIFYTYMYMYYLNIHLIVYNNIINHYQYELKSGRWWHVKVGEKSFVLRMLTSTKFNSMEQLEFLMVHQWIHILAWTWWNATIFCSRKLHSHEPLEISNSLKFTHCITNKPSVPALSWGERISTNTDLHTKIHILNSTWVKLYSQELLQIKNP